MEIWQIINGKQADVHCYQILVMKQSTKCEEHLRNGNLANNQCNGKLMSIRTVGLHHVNVLPFCSRITRLLCINVPKFPPTQLSGLLVW